jgi:hypothetical protein
MQQSNADFISGCYTLKGKILTPNSEAAKTILKALMICDSKHEGRPQYIASLTIGSARPKFISSNYEPRTPEGWFNFEHNGRRYEVVKSGEGEACIFEYKTRIRQ